MREAEYKRNIVNYLKKNLKKGYPLESLKWALVDQGYSRTLIDIAIKEANLELSKEVPALKEKPMITHEIVDEDNELVGKKSFWKRLFGMD
jgi:hypothetical protein